LRSFARPFEIWNVGNYKPKQVIEKEKFHGVTYLKLETKVKDKEVILDKPLFSFHISFVSKIENLYFTSTSTILLVSLPKTSTTFTIILCLPFSLYAWFASNSIFGLFFVL